MEAGAPPTSLAAAPTDPSGVSSGAATFLTWSEIESRVSGASGAMVSPPVGPADQAGTSLSMATAARSCELKLWTGMGVPFMRTNDGTGTLASRGIPVALGVAARDPLDISAWVAPVAPKVAYASSARAKMLKNLMLSGRDLAGTTG